MQEGTSCEHGPRFLFGAFGGYLKLVDLGAALLRQMRDETSLEGILLKHDGMELGRALRCRVVIRQSAEDILRLVTGWR
jgi:hypothetical protein